MTTFTISVTSDVLNQGSLEVALYDTIANVYLQSDGTYAPIPTGGPIPPFATYTSSGPQPPATWTLPQQQISGAFIFGIGGLPALVNAGINAPSEPDPTGISTIYDVVEISYDPTGNALTINTTEVNQFGLPIQIGIDPPSVMLPNGAGVSVDRGDLFADFSNFVGASFAQCTTDWFGNAIAERITSPQYTIPNNCVQGVVAASINDDSSSDLAAGAYYYAVTATSAAGEETFAQANVVQATVNGSQSVTIAWGSTQFWSGINGFNVYRATSATSWTLIQQGLPADALSYTDAGGSINPATPPLNPLNTFFDAEIQAFFAAYQNGNTLTLMVSYNGDYTFSGTTLPATSTPELMQFTLTSFSGATQEFPTGTVANIYYPYWNTNQFDAQAAAPPSWIPATYPSTIPASLMVFAPQAVFADNVQQATSNPPAGLDSSQIGVWSICLGTLENQIVSALLRGIANSSINPQNWGNGQAPIQLQPVAAPLPPGETNSLTPGDTYYYVITALNANGETTGSLEFNCVANPCVEVNWQPYDPSVVTSYNVYRGVESLGENSSFNVPNGTPPATFAVDYGQGAEGTPPSFFPAGGTWSGYAAFFHQPAISINGAAYAFSYDDQSGYSPTLSTANAVSFSLSIGPWGTS